MRSWSTKEEIKLLSAVITHKPAGVNKHFQLIAILDILNEGIENVEDRLTSEDILTKLNLLYDLDSIDEIEDNQDSPQEVQPKKDDFQLPYDSYGKLMMEKAIPEDTQENNSTELDSSTKIESPISNTTKKSEEELEDEDMTDSEVFEVKAEPDEIKEEIEKANKPLKDEKAGKLEEPTTEESQNKANQEAIMQENTGTESEEAEESADEEPVRSTRTSARLHSKVKDRPESKTPTSIANTPSKSRPKPHDKPIELSSPLPIEHIAEPEFHKPTTRSQSLRSHTAEIESEELENKTLSSRGNTPVSNTVTPEPENEEENDELSFSDHPSSHLRKSTRRRSGNMVTSTTATIEAPSKKRKLDHSQAVASATFNETDSVSSKRKIRTGDAAEESQNLGEQEVIQKDSDAEKFNDSQNEPDTEGKKIVVGEEEESKKVKNEDLDNKEKSKQDNNVEEEEGEEGEEGGEGEGEGEDDEDDDKEQKQDQYEDAEEEDHEEEEGYGNEEESTPRTRGLRSRPGSSKVSSSSNVKRRPPRSSTSSVKSTATSSTPRRGRSLRNAKAEEVITPTVKTRSKGTVEEIPNSPPSVPRRRTTRKK